MDERKNLGMMNSFGFGGNHNDTYALYNNLFGTGSNMGPYSPMNAPIYGIPPMPQNQQFVQQANIMMGYNNPCMFDSDHTLTDEEYNMIKSYKEGNFDFRFTTDLKTKYLCNHKYHGSHISKYVDHTGAYVECGICNKKIKPNFDNKETAIELTSRLINQIENIIWLCDKIDRETVKHLAGLIDMLKRYPDFYEKCRKTYSRFELEEIYNFDITGLD
jgi:hypothetical protein